VIQSFTKKYDLSAEAELQGLQAAALEKEAGQML
jgi:hypothetical protein